MTWKLVVALIITPIAGYYIYSFFGHSARITLDPAIPALQQENAQARQEIQALKQQSLEQERQAAHWRTEAIKHLSAANGLKARVKQLEEERKALKVVETLEQAWDELRRRGF